MKQSKDSAAPKEQKEEQKPFRSGEKGFAIFWLLFGGFFFYQSVLLYQKHPGLDSCAAIPLFVTGVVVVCSLIILLIDRKAPSESSGKPVGEVVKNTLHTMFPIDVVVTMVMILLYCIALYAGLGFYPSTCIFLWFAMTWFMRKQYRAANGFDGKAFVKVALKNVLWTAVCVLFILIVFTYLFKVVLP